jgi:dipeptidase D
MTNRTENVIKIFKEISRIPRQSGNRGPITTWIKKWSERNNFTCLIDPQDNVLIKIPASSGREGENPVILQGHSDMVCEKTPDSNHDFSKDPLNLFMEGEWLKARNTTLGADNGIAMAMAFDLAINGDISRPPLEILITSDEEIGLDGANALATDFLTGKQLINIDSEDEGVLTVGCAGGMDCLFDLPSVWENQSGTVYTLLLDGLAGGHSGVDIDQGRGSAIKLMGRLLSHIPPSMRIISLNSGSGATNAISRRAECVLLDLDNGKGSELDNLCFEWQKTFLSELGEADPGLTLTCKKRVRETNSCLNLESGKTLIHLINAMPHGVMAYSGEIEGLVETSTNLAAVITNGNIFHFATSQRSSVMSRLIEINARVEALAHLAGGTNLFTKNKYPAWQPDWNSSLLSKTKLAYEELFGSEPLVEVIHAGLETGVIGAKYPGMEMISLGPTIKNPHSPNEMLLVSTIDRVYRLICGILKP